MIERFGFGDDFPRNWEVTRTAGEPGLAVHSFAEGFNPRLLGGWDVSAPELRVEPHGAAPWMGAFAPGYHPPITANGVFSMPSADALTVVSYGQGYLLNASDPTSCRLIRAFPVLDVTASVEQRLRLYADFSSVFAYGKDGIRWVTPNLLFDGIEFDRVTPTTLLARADMPARNGVFPITVDLATGLVDY